LKLDLEAGLGGDKTPERREALPVRKSGPKGKPSQPPGSWWTTRATAGEVKGGFTKEEVLRTPELNPRADNGIFARLTSLLEALEAH
jgi:hypothetical protein